MTLYERHAQVGFVAHSVAVEGPGGAALRVDMPLRVFYPGYYPQLTRLYAALGVATEPVDYATTFMDDAGAAYFRWRNLRWRGWSLPYVLPQDVAGARARRILGGALRFNRQALAALAQGGLQGLSLADFVASQRMAPDYVHGLLLPTLATIATCTLQDALRMPADVVAGYLAAGLARQSVRRAVRGADDAATRLQAGITRVVCQAGVQGVRQMPRSVQVLRRTGPERFDHVVLATQANQALALWQDVPARDAAVLGAFRYRPLEVLVHRDTAFMPARRADWSPVNARVSPALDRPETTIWVNAVQPTLRQADLLLQTVHPQRAPRAHTVIAQARFERPLVDAGSQRTLAALQALQARSGRRVWLCGSYAQAGVPLLESAVQSAYAVAAQVAEAGRVPEISA